MNPRSAMRSLAVESIRGLPIETFFLLEQAPASRSCVSNGRLQDRLATRRRRRTAAAAAA